MDFIRVAYKENKDGSREYYPSLQAIESRDLVIRGGQFVAIWDDRTGLYSRRQSHVPDIIDRAFLNMVGDQMRPGDIIKKMRVFDNQLFNKLISLMRNIGDMGPDLDQTIVFADQTPSKDDAATFRMPYSLSEAPCPAWEEIISTLYDPEERLKIEWAIGSVFNGDAAENIQKFYVFFGPPGSGKSTIMNIIESLFQGHTAAFSAHAMGKSDAQFSLEPFKNNPLVAVDQDGDLSRIEMNQNLNSITSHDRVLINSKGKNLYEIIPRSTLFIGSNEPVKISNRKSGLFRRLVDIQPSGRLIPEEHYHNLMDQVMFELGAIATHCIGVFRGLGPTYLSSYRSVDMMYRTNDIFNFVQDNRLILAKGVTLKQAHKLYTEWCAETDTRNVYKQYQFRDLLQDYFKEFHHEIMIEGNRHRSYFMELRELEKFSWKGLAPAPPKNWLELDAVTHSILDDDLANEKAQLYSGNPTHPLKKPWSAVETTLSQIDPTKEHYVTVPREHIVIDFDLKDEHGQKSLQRNLDAAAHWPATYAEVSRGGGGLHLHYLYDGDAERLADRGEDGSYEIKTLLGNASLRRKLTLANTLAVATISSGLPFKEEKVLSAQQMSSEKSLRNLIIRALKKEIHSGTKPNMDFIKKVLEDAERDGMVYDVSDMFDDIFSFAMGSTNQKNACLEIASGLKLKSEQEVEAAPEGDEKPEVFFDLEVYPNLFAIGWMYDQDDAPVVRMVNPTAHQVQEWVDKVRLSGYNNRFYDNHILWAAMLGYNNQQLYELSQAIVVDKNREKMFGAAYNLHYSDVFDYLSEKKTLKWWQIKLGLPHMEMDLPWDLPVNEEDIPRILDYLDNDVRSTRAVRYHRDQDFRARQIIAELAGMEVCNTTKQITERLIFGNVPWDTQSDLVYTDLSERFPGYAFDQFKPGKEKSTYKGEQVGEGGWVHAKPGMYENVAVLDVASMHPTSIIELNLFGPATEKFKDLMDVRLALKRGDYDKAASLYDGRLEKFIVDPHEGYNPKKAKELSNALKIVINSVYGLTAASFPNKFKDPRNKDNIVAKRGALFMVDLKEFIESKGFQVVHVKTDSVKIPDATPEIIKEVEEFGRGYGYQFEHEETYSRLCLVNDAVYVAATDAAGADREWTAVGAQFQHPIVFKTLFSKEDFDARDYVETKQVTKGAMYLVSEEEGTRQFVGRFGAFTPVLGGRQLLRIDGEKEYAVGGTKGYLWELDEVAQHQAMEVDMDYFQKLVTAGMQTIEKFGSFAEFTRP